MAAVHRPARSIEQVIAELDEDIRLARYDVDESLLDGTLAMSPLQRLNAASASTTSLLSIRSRFLETLRSSAAKAHERTHG